MTLVDSTNMEAIIPFAEADAAGIKPNQPATLTFDAISGLTIYGHVLQVSPTPTVVSNVTNYYVSFVLNNSDPRLRPGMTVNAVVTVNESDNVIAVPNAAVHTASDGTTTVTVLDPNGQQEQREVEIGLVGDSATEIKRGLNAGEKVVLPTVRLSTTTGGGAGGRGFFFGGGGGGAIRGGG
jgi:multidrug efflux pump subunit AcrA (membrane-fusion protein)